MKINPAYDLRGQKVLSQAICSSVTVQWKAGKAENPKFNTVLMAWKYPQSLVTNRPKARRRSGIQNADCSYHSRDLATGEARCAGGTDNDGAKVGLKPRASQPPCRSLAPCPRSARKSSKGLGHPSHSRIFPRTGKKTPVVRLRTYLQAILPC